MAPKYAMEGLYSVKSDVYSFGAWLQWNEEQVVELMDPLVADSCVPNEFLRYLHIGLLCVEEDAYNRLSMSPVVMLKSESTNLCQPK
ncbi:Protein kinase-like domain containing protein [Parasponia andersonii]|uniref:Protein kinase-like domain containing protein n=1 Tax=Parasponia andersonii TaxID=3476 RepID=A0A2P5AWV2_PARAD|nr:Protein kinase-like domain containing protein [Parasponia andersonii]